jgi:predicted metal-binding membrane protein
MFAELDEAFVATWVFVAAYMLVWALSGIAAYPDHRRRRVITVRTWIRLGWVDSGRSQVMCPSTLCATCRYAVNHGHA